MICISCGLENDQNFCTNCGLHVTGSEQLEVTESVQYLGWTLRFVSLLINLAPVVILAVIVRHLENDYIGHRINLLPYLSYMIFFIGYSLLLIVQIGRTGQTPGLAAVGGRLVREESGEVLGVVQGVVRVLANILNLVIGWFFPIWDKRKRTLADKVMKTAVIKTGKHSYVWFPSSPKQQSGRPVLLTLIIAIPFVMLTWGMAIGGITSDNQHLKDLRTWSNSPNKAYDVLLTELANVKSANNDMKVTWNELSRDCTRSLANVKAAYIGSAPPDATLARYWNDAFSKYELVFSECSVSASAGHVINTEKLGGYIDAGDVYLRKLRHAYDSEFKGMW
jgi:uncharacterized RDD family membrane protein YckC